MAITLADAGRNGGLPYTGAGGTLVMPLPCSPNDLIIAAMQILNATANGTPVLSDNVNAGAYSPLGAPWWDSSNGFWVANYYKACNAIGVPTIATGSLASIGSAAGGSISACRFTGFVGIPTLDGALLQQALGNVAAVAGPALTTNYNPELLLSMIAGKNLHSVAGVGGGWSSTAYATSLYPSYKIDAVAAGQAESCSLTADVFSNWVVQSAGFYSDASSNLLPTDQIPLDDPSRIGGSSELVLGSVYDDHLGAKFRDGGVALKLWATDLNAMLLSLSPKTKLLGDADLVLVANDSARVIYQNATLTADRSITLPSSGLTDGLRFVVVRKATPPGAYKLTVVDPLSAKSSIIASGTNGFAHWRAVSLVEWICTAQGTYP